MHKWIWGLCAALLLTTGFWGCSFSSFTDGEGRELDFTVVSRSELPEEVEAVLSQQLGISVSDLRVSGPEDQRVQRAGEEADGH